MNFINTLETVLSQLATRGWKVDKDVDTKGNFSHHFDEQPGFTESSAVTRWAVTSHNGYGFDCYVCIDANYLLIEYDAGGYYDGALDGNLDEIDMSEQGLLDLLIKTARDSAAANA